MSGVAHRPTAWLPYCRFHASADTDVPDGQGPQALNRYAFVLNNPLKYTDPSGHEPCEYGTGNFCQGGSRNTSRYDPYAAADPILQRQLHQQQKWGQLSTKERLILQDAGWDQATYTAEFITGNAIRVSPPGIDEVFDPRNLDEAVLANQYAPLAFSAISTLSAEAQALVINPALASKNPTVMVEAAAATLFNQALGRGAAFAGLAATAYQYNHGLYGTTKGDLDVTNALTVVGVVPHPAVQLPATHVSTMYTALRTFGVIEPIDVYYQRFTGQPWPWP